MEPVLITRDGYLSLPQDKRPLINGKPYLRIGDSPFEDTVLRPVAFISDKEPETYTFVGCNREELNNGFSLIIEEYKGSKKSVFQTELYFTARQLYESKWHSSKEDLNNYLLSLPWKKEPSDEEIDAMYRAYMELQNERMD